MKVTEVRLYAIPSMWRELTIVQLRTDEGITGLGEIGVSHEVDRGTLHVVRAMAESFVLGKDPRHVESLWDTMNRYSFWGRGGGAVVMAAISAIEEACWDIFGKSVGLPAFMLLGGKVRERIRLYANGWWSSVGALASSYGLSPAEWARDAERVVKDGFTALKFDPFRYTAPDQGAVPQKSMDRRAIAAAMERIAAVRRAVGPDVDILIEAHGWFDVHTAIEIGQRLEEYDVLFFEEPIESTSPQAMANVAANIRTPVAAGERIYTRWGFLPYLEANAMRILQPDIGNTGGMLETRKIAAMADVFHLPIAPHNPWGPVATAAAVHVDAATPNFLIQEWFPYEKDDHYRVVDHAYELDVREGHLTIPDDRPGLGVELNEAAVAAYLVDTVVAR
jgi:galactonate dehydratase